MLNQIAHSEGWQAFYNEEEITDNPYEKYTQAHRDWEEGFNGAEYNNALTN